MVQLLEAAAKGDNELRAVVQKHGFDEAGMWAPTQRDDRREPSLAAWVSGGGAADAARW